MSEHSLSGTLILLCGLPGSGKTTLSKQLAIERRAIRLCPDDWIEAILADATNSRERDRLRDPIENLQLDLALDFLKQGFTVILENGFWSEEERTLYAVSALNVGAKIELHYLEAPEYEDLWRRVERRNAELESPVFRMTRDDLIANFRVFEAPTPDELEFYDEGIVVPWS